MQGKIILERMINIFTKYAKQWLKVFSTISQSKLNNITYYAEQAYEVCLAILEYILYALTQVVL